MSAMRERRLTGRHVLFAMLAFFGVVIATNAVFVVLALDTWTGVSTDDAYRRGLDYNTVLRAAEDQKALGWTGEIAFEPLGEGQGRIAATFTDRNGNALEHLTVRAEVRRPTHEGHDHEVALDRSGPGRYGAELTLPLRGQWDVRLHAEGRDGARFVIEDRIWLK